VLLAARGHQGARGAARTVAEGGVPSPEIQSQFAKALLEIRKDLVPACMA